MATEHFASAATRTPLVFCDANFLLDIGLRASNALQNAVPNNRLKQARAADEFRRRYQSSGTRFISSPYALEEILHKVSMSSLPAAHKSWKDFKSADPVGHGKARSAAHALALELWSALRNANIEFAVPRAGGGAGRRSVVNRQVVQAALDIYKVYPGLDWADAFHIAMALACGSRWIATADRAFQDVAEINVFAP